MVSEQVQHKHRKMLEILDLESKKKLYHPCSKNKGADQLHSYCNGIMLVVLSCGSNVL